MGTVPAGIVGHCEKCGASIPAGHPYAWCSKCGTSLPAAVKQALPHLPPPPSPLPPARAKEVALVVDGREIPCPICGHRRFRMRKATMESGIAAWFDLEWTTPVAETYICLHCGHVMWFMR